MIEVRKPSLAAYDVDRTLVPGAITDRGLWAMEKDGLFPQDDSRLAELRNWQDTDSPEYWGTFISHYTELTKGLGVAAMRKTAEAMARQDVKDIYRPMRKRLQEDAKHHQLALISGAPQQFLLPFARELAHSLKSELDESELAENERIFAIGSRFYEAGGQIHRWRPPRGRATEKDLPLQRISYKYGLTIARAYGDSMSDLSMLEADDEPVGVNPSTELLEEATKRGWQIITCNKENSARQA
jgi:phosphoserine phosphatase